MSILCLVPPELEGKLLALLRRHYEGEDVEVLVEHRGRERRSPRDRRTKDTGPPKGEDERRLIRNLPDSGGRRVGERRTTLVSVDPPLELPRKAQPYADQLLFCERVEASAEHIEDLDTARLVTRIQAGDQAGFAELYSRYFDRVYGYLRVLLKDSHEAEDVAQQSFIDVFEALPRYERRSQPFRAWLFTIVRNRAIKQLRAARRMEPQAEAEISRSLEANGGEEQDLSALRWITDQDLMLFVERLPVAQRQVLLLRFMLGCSTKEIAEILDRSEEAVRMQQSRALGFLRQRLSAIGRGPSRRRAPALVRIRQARVIRLRRFSLTSPGPTG